MRHSSRLPRGPARRAGFTVIELIVVIGIVALLMSLLLVGLKLISSSARTTSCLSHLRELSHAHAAYSNLYQECFVDVGLPHGGGGDPSRSFVTTLQSFGVTEEALRSPLDLSPHWPPEGGDGAPVTIVNGQPVYRRTSYGMNAYLSRSYSPILAFGGGIVPDRIDRVRKPSQTVCFLLMTERGSYASSDHPHVENWGAVSTPALIAASQVAIGAIDRRKPSGDSRSNWSYLDGHVTSARFDEVYLSITDNRFDPGL